ncbi:carbon-nitrogen hydrolase family protein [Rhizobium puerariae]|uniref:Carbon-nitrogen hydrolase family protein n=1 Tax=Rhizobium puerariae TaxID=1585791 RepID=A0ABV6ACN6_9HYPH
MPTICAVEWPDGLLPESDMWRRIRDEVDGIRPDIIVTNEMPFGAWLPKQADFDGDAARQWVNLHERALDALRDLAPAAVISSRPVLAGDRLANEAFALEGGRYEILHHKQLFPAEEGWEEEAWFAPAISGFATKKIGGVETGILLCTELMFNEKARHLGRSGAQLIAVPRAAGMNRFSWQTAGSMAAIVSGAYVVSSNRVGNAAGGPPMFGGGGFTIDPSGKVIGSTASDRPIITIEVDLAGVDTAKHEYPVYVDERHIREER